MIDIENQLYSKLTDLLTNEIPNINYSSVFVNSPRSFPFVSIEEIDNYTSQKYEDNSSIEKFTNLVYEINVHTEDNTKKKSLAKQIVNIVDDFMFNLGFRRLSKTPVQGDNETSFRIVLRYSAVVSNESEIFRR